MKIAINGLGRIGRCILRAYYEMNYKQNNLEIVAVNSRSSIEQQMHLLKYDSVHGIFAKEITQINNAIKIDDDIIQFHNQDNPKNIEWGEVDLVLECSGAFNQKEKAVLHNVPQVLISAPVLNADSTIIYGVNNKSLKENDQVISAGSCTTNCFAPIVSILHDKIGIEHGFMSTVHSYTNDQNIVDNSHKKDWRRARSCGVSMVPTSTGAAKMIGRIIPELKDKIDGSAIRVPVANVSMIDFTFTASKETTVEEINSVVQEASQESMKGIIGYCVEPLVSIDFNHNPHSAIFDSLETKVVDRKCVRVLAWYDNEWGFSARMLDVACLLKK